jgi:hypothetical protein
MSNCPQKNIYLMLLCWLTQIAGTNLFALSRFTVSVIRDTSMLPDTFGIRLRSLRLVSKTTLPRIQLWKNEVCSLLRACPVCVGTRTRWRLTRRPATRLPASQLDATQEHRQYRTTLRVWQRQLPPWLSGVAEIAKIGALGLPGRVQALFAGLAGWQP